MKKIIILSLASIIAGSSFAMGPNFICESEDGVKQVRVVDGPWSRKVAKIYHNGVIHRVLNCVQNTASVLYACQDDAVPPRRFTLDYDQITGHYEGTEEVRDFTCRHTRDTAE